MAGELETIDHLLSSITPNIAALKNLMMKCGAREPMPDVISENIPAALSSHIDKTPSGANRIFFTPSHHLQPSRVLASHRLWYLLSLPMQLP